jgi:hypothetical protein
MPIKYTFYVEHSNGTQITWTGLTLKRARDMHAYTNAHQPCDATRHGWYEERMAFSVHNEWAWHEAKAQEHDAQEQRAC